MQKAVADTADASVVAVALPAAAPAAAPHAAAPHTTIDTTVYPVLLTLSFCHLLNDMMQSLLPALYPVFKDDFHLDFTQIGLITLAFQMTASMLQPLVGLYTDRKPQPYSLAIGMGFTLVGLLLLATTKTFGGLVMAASLVGMGSSVFHPEASRVARMASGGRYGLAQAVFQVGGNAGWAIGPLLAALVVLPRGQGAIAWFSLAALLGMFVLTTIARWYQRHSAAARAKARAHAEAGHGLSRGRVAFAIFVLVALIFSKNVYQASLSSYYTFYLMRHFGLAIRDAQILLFIFAAAIAVGTLAGGPVGDRIGRKPMMWISILGVLPFTLALPYSGLYTTAVLTVVIGFTMASAFPAILVYAQELLPGRVGMVAGIFFGFSFGLGGIGAAALGRLADATTVEFVYQVVSYLPAIGLLTALLPNLDDQRRVGRG